MKHGSGSALRLPNAKRSPRALSPCWMTKPMARTTRLIIQSISGLAVIATPWALYAAFVTGSPLLLAGAALLSLGAAVLAVAANV